MTQHRNGHRTRTPARRHGDVKPANQADASPSVVGRLPRLNMPAPGTSAGIETSELSALPSSETPMRVSCADYSPERVQIEAVGDIDAFLAAHRPAWAKVRWINVVGLNRMETIRAFAEKYQLHPLAIEDMLGEVHRPKLEDYEGSEELPGRLFIVARMVEIGNDELRGKQISMFLGRTTLLSFQDEPSPIFDKIQRRIEAAGSRLRTHDVSFLLHALLDAVVDSYFPVLEHYGERLEEFDDELRAEPTPQTLQRIHAVKRNLALLRRSIWPMRELVVLLQRDQHECLSETTLTYFRDIYDHCAQIIDLVESYREISAALTETYMAVMSNRMNEIMKVLTVIGTIFIPLTFLAGVYGMNMPIPENAWPEAYPVFWLVCVATAVGMLVWFRRRGWV